ncbi:MAG: molybdenum cofactor guanylyltransferase [Alkalinema sp. CAN_BIN05]|nr:molybdenum cofactor guanylyltransferase [Alkalinema sp. CAN_BIN05]
MPDDKLKISAPVPALSSASHDRAITELKMAQNMASLPLLPFVFKPVITPIVLAGGQSKRMGRDKALLELDGVPLLTRTCNLGLAVSNIVYVVSSRDYARVIPEGCDRIDDRVLNGPLYGFAEALDQIGNKLQTNWILLLSCDLPYLDSDTLNQWILQLDQVPEDAIAYLAKNSKGFYEVLCGFYRIECKSSLIEYINQGGRSFQQWLRSQTVEELVWDDRRVFFNCNTPEDWQNAVSKSSTL